MALTSDAEASLKMMTPATPQRSHAYFTELNPADNSKFIEARVYRKWTAMKVPSLIPTGFSCILLDKKVQIILYSLTSLHISLQKLYPYNESHIILSIVGHSYAS